MRIEVGVRAQVYTWTVTNVDAPPIMSFEAGHHRSFNHRAPEGWTVETDRDRFRAWTEDEGLAIGQGRSGTFTARTSSGGAILGEVPAIVGTAGGGRIRFDAIWGPVPKPRGLVALVAVVLTAIAAGYVVAALRRSGRGLRVTRAGPVSGSDP